MNELVLERLPGISRGHGMTIDTMKPQVTFELFEPKMHHSMFSNYSFDLPLAKH